ncbi:MAG: hypothetical protein SCALA702_00770 [Melioribacteraceae bacterium]|nr:MAG: hypothetical protein SCALA702_00770 [Melioribacteraceae bacterium]
MIGYIALKTLSVNVKKRIYEFTIKTIVAIVLITVGFIIFLNLGTHVIIAGKTTSDWWTALSVITALYIAVLVFSFIKSKEVDILNKEIEQIKEKLNDVSEVSSISLMLVDLYDESIFTNKELWNENYKKILLLYELSKKDGRILRKFSTIAWKKGQSETCYKLRKSAYEAEPESFINRAYLISVLPYIEDKKGLEIPRYLRKETKIEKFISYPDSLEDKYKAFCDVAYGRLLLKKGKYDKAIKYLEKAVAYDEVLWHYRTLVIAFMLKGDFKALENSIKKWEKEETSWRDTESGTSKRFKCFINAFFEEYYQENCYKSRREFYSMFHSLFISKHSNFQSFDKLSTFALFSSLNDHLKNFDKSHKINILRIYLTFYLLFAENDEDADIELSNHKINEILKFASEY